jgi:hypothetical protein
MYGTYGIYLTTPMLRLSTENLLEPVTRELDFQLQPPFLLYKYDPKQCIVPKKLRSLLLTAGKIL